MSEILFNKEKRLTSEQTMGKSSLKGEVGDKKGQVLSLPRWLFLLLFYQMREATTLRLFLVRITVCVCMYMCVCLWERCWNWTTFSNMVIICGEIIQIFSERPFLNSTKLQVCQLIDHIFLKGQLGNEDVQNVNTNLQGVLFKMNINSRMFRLIWDSELL